MFDYNDNLCFIEYYDSYIIFICFYRNMDKSKNKMMSL